MKYIFFITGILFSLLPTQRALAKSACSNIDREILVAERCTKIETYKSQKNSDNPTLAIVLHGDSAFIRPFVQNRVAQKIAENNDNVIAVGMLRPGYKDDFGRKSDGEMGLTVGDNYDDERVKQITDAIKSLKHIHKAGKVVLIGHSGGAAITTRIIGLYPNLIDHAVAISCPCNINAWRKDMLLRNEYEPFRGDLPISSPIELATNVSDKIKISLLVAKKDDVTKPYLTKQYYTELKKQGKHVEMKIIEGGHNIFQTNAAMEIISKAL